MSSAIEKDREPIASAWKILAWHEIAQRSKMFCF